MEKCVGAECKIKLSHKQLRSESGIDPDRFKHEGLFATNSSGFVGPVRPSKMDPRMSRYYKIRQVRQDRQGEVQDHSPDENT